MDDMKEFIKRAENLMKPAVREAVNRTTRYNAKYVKKCNQNPVRKVLERIRIRKYCELMTNASEEVKEFYRNRPEGMVVDHIIPISKGGDHVLSNLQYLTVAQNSSKGNRDRYHHVFD